VLEQQLVNGLMLGSSYALVAVGYTLVFGVLKLLNLAHGEVFMFSGYIGLVLLASLELPLTVAIAGTMAGAAVLSVLLERVSFRPIDLTRHEIAPVLSTIGFGIALQQLAVRVWGSTPERVSSGISDVEVRLGDVQMSLVSLLGLIVALALMVLLGLMVRRTAFGRGMRAIADSREVAELLGVDTRRIVLLTFAISGLLAGAAGILVALRTGSVAPTVGLDIGFKALAVMVIGGLGSLEGAVLAGLVLGVLEVLTIAYGSAAYGDGVVWGALLVVLLLRPSGLFGERVEVSGRA
jgi:branched-chain amino acid transport system permease protein